MPSPPRARLALAALLPCLFFAIFAALAVTGPLATAAPGGATEASAQAPEAFVPLRAPAAGRAALPPELAAFSAMSPGLRALSSSSNFPLTLPAGNTAWRVTPEATSAPEIAVGRIASALVFFHTFVPGSATRAWQRASFDARWAAGPGDDWRRLVREWKKPQVPNRYATALPPEPPTVLRYRVRYADGEVIDAPVRFGEGIHAAERDDFFTREDGFLGPLRWAEIAWRSASDERGRCHVAYAMTWPNPRPEKLIASVRPLPPADAASPSPARGVAAAEAATTTAWGSAYVFGVALDPRPPVGRRVYVSPAGDDTASGDYDRPFASPARALAALAPGDTLFFRGGRYAVNQRLSVQLTGRADAWTTISAYPGESPVLDFAGFAALDELPAKGWSVLATPQLDLGGSRFLRLRGLTLENLISTGIGSSASKQGGAEDVEVSFNTIHRSYHSGLFLAGRRVRAIGNLLLRTCYTRTLFDFADRFPVLRADPWVASILQDHVSGKSLRHECLDIGGTGSSDLEAAFNEVAHGNKESIDCKGGPRGVRIHHNFVHQTTMPTGIYVDAWTKPLRDVEVSRNVVCHTAVTGIAVASEGGSGAHDVRIVDNWVFANGYSGILLSRTNEGGLLENMRVERNLIVGNGTAPVGRSGQGGIHIGTTNLRGVVIRENRFVGNRHYTVATDVDWSRIAPEITCVDNHAWTRDGALPPAGSPLFPGATDARQAAWLHVAGVEAHPLAAGASDWAERIAPAGSWDLRALLPPLPRSLSPTTPTSSAP